NWFVHSARTTGWLRETELVPKTQGVVAATKQTKFALALAKRGKVPPPFPPHVAEDVQEARALYDVVRSQGVSGAAGIVQGADTLMTICNVCTLNLRQANYQLQNDDALRERVSDNLERVGAPRYSGGVEVKHLLWLIADGDGYEKLKEVAHKGLKGLKVAPFYGCQILRPS